MEPNDALERGRNAHAARAWGQAYDALSRADREAPLDAPDIELLATAAYMLGRDDEWMAGLERAQQRYVEGGDRRRAAHCAGWIGVNHMLRGEMGPATGWLGRAQRLLEEEGDCVERGYALIPDVFRNAAAGDWEAAAASAGEAAAIGRRFGDPDLFALATHAQGQMLTTAGQVAEGLALLDEAMVALTTSELSPIVAGLVYCGVILACQEVYEVRRAQEWTAALSRWCEGQSDLVAFTGRCLVHRAEILQLAGDWNDALLEARRAGERLSAGFNQGAAPTRSTARESSIAFGATWPMPSARTGTRAASGASRSRASLSCASLRGAATPRRRRSVVCSARRPCSIGARACSRPPWRSSWRWASSKPRAGHARSSRCCRTGSEASCCAGSHARRGVRSSWRRASRPAPSSRCGGRSRPGRSSTRPTRRRGRAELVGLACRALGDEDTAALRAGRGPCRLRGARRRPRSPATERRGPSRSDLRGTG